MPREITAPPMSGFFKWTAMGQLVVGRVEGYRTSDNGPFVRISPAIIRESSAAPLEMFDGVAVGLTTDLKLKITPREVGSFISIRFSDTEPTKKSPRKIFTVEVLNRAELDELAKQAGRTHRQEQYVTPGGSPPASQSVDEEGDLPF